LTSNAPRPALARALAGKAWTSIVTDFDAWFERLAGAANRPYAWQRSLAAHDEPRSRLVRIPTGMGKTLGILAAWAWHRLHRDDDAWPRRLVWCLPMRVLVEQTDAVVRDALRRLGKGFRPRLTWWMSATLQPVWLKSVDTEPRYDDWVRERGTIGASQASLSEL
jgi:hypothetical protein